MAASTDYDAPRRNPDPFMTGLRSRGDAAEEGPTVLVLPLQAGEFTCTSCNRSCPPSQHSSSTTVCLDCAA